MWVYTLSCSALLLTLESPLDCKRLWNRWASGSYRVGIRLLAEYRFDRSGHRTGQSSESTPLLWYTWKLGAARCRAWKADLQITEWQTSVSSEICVINWSWSNYWICCSDAHHQKHTFAALSPFSDNAKVVLCMLLNERLPKPLLLITLPRLLSK